MLFLNSGDGYEYFVYESKKSSYVDKSMLVSAVYNYAQNTNKYICVARPRRFGKSTAANMVAAFFDPCRAKESRQLFETMNIGEKNNIQSDCWEWQGKINVIRINMIDVITEKTKSYEDFIRELSQYLIEDILEAYPDLQLKEDVALTRALKKTGKEFVFVIDEWDAIFEMPFMRDKDRKEYILFLKALLKDKNYVKFAYMTGVLPIAKYSSGSPLNMFDEFTSFQDEIFYPYFGLTKTEIERLKETKGFQKPSMEELSFWYDGYIRRSDNEHIYNPNSVSKALASGVCTSYWTGTGPMNEVRDLIQHNVNNLRNDIIRMVGGEVLTIKLGGFDAEKAQISTRDEILSAMVVYGFLTYHDEKLAIPNHELSLKFQEALAHESMGLKQTIENSRELITATLQRNHGKIAQLIEELHDEKIPFFQYNDENSLACVIVVGYLAALDNYNMSREDKAGKGFVDFCFTPMRQGDIPIILELKYNHSAKNALQCIHKKDYIQKYKSYKQVLLLGINYSERTKKHTCLTELVEQGNS